MPQYCITLFDTIENPISNDECFITASQNLTLNRGSSYRIIFNLTKNNTPVNLTGYSLRGKIKPSSNSDIILYNMTSANKLLKIDHSSSSIVMYFTETFTYHVQNSVAIYDIELITPSAEASKIVTGMITFIPTV